MLYIAVIWGSIVAFTGVSVYLPKNGSSSYQPLLGDITAGALHHACLVLLPAAGKPCIATYGTSYHATGRGSSHGGGHGQLLSLPHLH